MKLNNLKNLTDLAQAAAAPKGKQILTVPVSSVVSKVQVRKLFTNIDELATSILAEGLQSPIIVSPINSEGHYTIQKGERRWRACKQAGIETIDIIINAKTQSQLDETAGELVENIQREGLTPLEICNAIQVFVENNWTHQRIADRIGKNRTFITTHLALRNLPDCVRSLHDQGICLDTDTLYSLRQLFDLQPERCRSVCEIALTEGVSRKQARDLVQDAKRLVGEGSQPPSQKAHHDGNGATATIATATSVVGTDGQVKSQLQAQVQTGSEDGNNHLGNSRTQATGSISERGGLLSASLARTEAEEENLAKWKAAEPAYLIFAVNVKLAGELVQGVILTDRVALNPETVWVSAPDSEGQLRQFNVSIKDIQLLSVQG